MLRRIALALAAGLLMGCGGGEGSGSADPGPAAVPAEAEVPTPEEAARMEAEALALPMDEDEPAAAAAVATDSTHATLSALADWVLELPVSSAGLPSGTPMSIPVAAIIAGNPAPPSFLSTHFRVVGQSLRFSASPYGALTSSAAGGARCEAKQVGTSRWNPLKGRHRLQLRQTLAATPAGRSPGVVLGQVHDDENLIMIKYQGPAAARGTKEDVGTLRVEFNHRDPAGIMVMDAQYRVGTAFGVTLEVADGVATVTYVKGSVTRRFTHGLKPAGGSAYFKVGVYPQRHRTGDPAHTGSATVMVSEVVVR